MSGYVIGTYTSDLGTYLDLSVHSRRHAQGRSRYLGTESDRASAVF